MTENTVNNPSVISLSVSATFGGLFCFLLMTALPFLGTAANTEYGWNVHVVHAMIAVIISLLLFFAFISGRKKDRHHSTM